MQIKPKKLSIPKIQDIFPRQELIQEIEKYSDNRIIWIYGPMGCGKTTLAACFASQKSYVIWYHIDETDKNFISFFEYLYQAAHYISSNLNQLPHFTDCTKKDPLLFSQQFFTALFSSIPEIYLVLDNLDILENHIEFHNILITGLEEISPIKNIIITSRSHPKQIWKNSPVYKMLYFITWDKLQLSYNEIKTIATRKAEKKLTTQEIQKLQTLTQGWVAGLKHLVNIEAILACEPISMQVLYQNAEVIFNYFTEEIWNTLPQEAQKILALSSLFDLIFPSLLDQIIQENASIDILNNLVDKNYFIIKNSDKTFYYHPLFHAFLSYQAHIFFNTSYIYTQHLKIADLFYKNKLLEPAIRHFILAQAWQKLIYTLLENTISLLAEEKHSILLKWIDTIPQEQINQNLSLQISYAQALLPNQPKQAQEYLINIFNKLYRNTSENAQSLTIIWTDIIYSCWLLGNTIEENIFWVTILENIQLSCFHTDNYIIYSIFYLFYFYPQNALFEIWQTKAYQAINTNTTAWKKLQIINGLKLQYFLQGEIQPAIFLLKETDLLIEQTHISTTLFLSLQTNSLINIVQGKFEQAEKTLEQCEKIIKDKNIIQDMHWHYIFAKAFYQCNLGKVQSLDILLKKFFQSTYKEASIQYNFIKIIQAWSYYINKNITHGLEILLTLQEETQPSSYITALYYFGLIYGYFKLQQIKEYQDYLNKLKNLLPTIDSIFIHYISLQIEAYILIETGQTQDKIFSLIKQIIIYNKERHLIGQYWWLPEVMVTLYKTALYKNIEVAFVQKTILKHQLKIIADYDNYLAKWPWVIKILTFGKFNVYINNKLINISYLKSLMILKVIIALGGKNIPRHQIADIIWPESEADKANKNLDTYLHRLRNLMVYKESILLISGLITLNEEYCWVDSLVWNKKLIELENIIQQPFDLEKILSIVAIILKLYQGQFLREENNILFEKTKDIFSLKLVQILENVAQRLIAHKAIESVLEIYEAGLLKEPQNATLELELQTLYIQYSHFEKSKIIKQAYQKYF